MSIISPDTSTLPWFGYQAKMTLLASDIPAWPHPTDEIAEISLGDIIKAGLNLRELPLQQAAERCVISAPPGMVVQRNEEMRAHFGVNVTILDRACVSTVHAQRGFRANAWDTGLFLMSLSVSNTNEPILFGDVA